MTTVLGVNINLIYALIFALGSALAGFAGFAVRTDPDRLSGHGRQHPDPDRWSC